ncbi:hypothetical protein Q4Q35_07790 [Flavivirga aquimarina]|uniref:Uncharacterized protein n=1 Tax=Flavivirga aquimarina TaxID=2027862 RepID=A0ABT8W9D3_9FLAO|nr:hypothetical protein [Flavivirga aquimarina]MDO5969706.1 hypothetical protein [Flavivirga aquimarina]
MKTNNTIQEKIESTFSAMDAIEEVKISPFFKDKTMRKLFEEKEEEKVIWSWFTPKLQLATLVCLILINAYAFTNLSADNHEDNVEEFAETFGLSTNSDIDLFN